MTQQQQQGGIPPGPGAPAAAAGGATAAAGGPPAAPATPGTHPTPPASYKAFYALDQADPYGGSYTGLLTEFRTENNPPTGAEIFASLKGAQTGYPAAFLSVQKRGGEAYYQVFHALSRYPRSCKKLRTICLD